LPNIAPFRPLCGSGYYKQSFRKTAAIAGLGAVDKAEKKAWNNATFDCGMNFVEKSVRK
jgi:hypothetical protein